MKTVPTPKASIAPKKMTSPKLVAKSAIKDGLGIFKESIISKPSAWKDDLRCTVKQ